MTRRTLGDALNELGAFDNHEPADEPVRAASTPAGLAPGDSIHFYGPMAVEVSESFHAPSVYVGRGSTLKLTEAALRGNRDRNGWSWLEIIDDIPEQIRRYKKQLFGRGSFPADEPLFEPGSPEAADERDRRLEAASKLPETEAKAERARIREQFGTRDKTTVLGTFRGNA